ncbi:MAG: hypothetical protein N2Z74_03590 [Syntrophales bacterium]|nr:hypothetical protein [Syntrophales bacterium]
MEWESRLIPVLRDGIDIVKMILFKVMREGFQERYPDRERTFAGMLAGAVINEIFCTPNREEPFASFLKDHAELVAEETKRVASDYAALRIPLTDALRIQFLCDSREGYENPQLLIQARDLGILIVERQVPMPDQFMRLIRTLGEAYHLTRHIPMGTA